MKKKYQNYNNIIWLAKAAPKKCLDLVAPSQPTLHPPSTVPNTWRPSLPPTTHLHNMGCIWSRLIQFDYILIGVSITNKLLSLYIDFNLVYFKNTYKHHTSSNSSSSHQSKSYPLEAASSSIPKSCTQTYPSIPSVTSNSRPRHARDDNLLENPSILNNSLPEDALHTHKDPSWLHVMNFEESCLLCWAIDDTGPSCLGVKRWDFRFIRCVESRGQCSIRMLEGEDDDFCDRISLLRMGQDGNIGHLSRRKHKKDWQWNKCQGKSSPLLYRPVFSTSQ